MIVHGHVVVGEQRMNVPGYHVLRAEEEMIAYHPSSPYNDPNHEMRQEMERRRETIDGEGGPEEGIGMVREQSTQKAFVEQIKSDEAKLPTTEDTVPEAEAEELRPPAEMDLHELKSALRRRGDRMQGQVGHRTGGAFGLTGFGRCFDAPRHQQRLELHTAWLMSSHWVSFHGQVGRLATGDFSQMVRHQNAHHKE